MTELTLTEAARSLGIAASTLRHQVREGRLRARMAGKTYLVAPEEIERYRAHSRGRVGRPTQANSRRSAVVADLVLDREALRGLAERWGIRSISVFGSVARGEARP